MADLNKDINIKVKGDTSDINSKLSQTGQKGKEMGDKVAAGGEKGKNGLNKMGNAADGVKTDLAAVAVSIQGMTSSIAGMGQQILDFESKVIALQKTAVGLEGQELALERAQQDLNRAVREGTITDLEFSRALEDIELAYKNVVLEGRNVEAETKKLSGEYVSFGITAVGTVAQISVAFVAMGITAGGVLKGVTAGVRLLSGALWTVVKHPVFLIITAGILAWELGLKSIVEDLTGIEDLGIFSNMQKAFEGLTEGENSMEALDNQTRAFGDTVEKNLPVFGSEAEALDKVADSAGNATKEIKGLTVAQERLMRSGGFRSGPGNPLSKVINEEADKISAATARTLAAASLHARLKEIGFSGSLFSSNISGSLNKDGFKPANKKGGPLGGLGDLALQMFNQGVDSSAIAKSLAKGAGTSSGAIGGLNGLTKSGSLSKSRGAGQGKRRSGRDRNPLGRTDKLSVRFNKTKDAKFGLNNRNIIALEALTGLSADPGFKSVRFGNNSGLSSNERRSSILDYNTRRFQEASLRLQQAFQLIKQREGLDEVVNLSAQKFIKLRGTPGGFKEIRGVLNYQKKAGIQVTGTTL